MKQTHIYGLRDPRDGQIRYIGKANDPVARLAEHLKDRGVNRGKETWLAELASAALRPEVTILEMVDDSEWPEAERRWIAQGKADGWVLLNIQPGGVGADYRFMRSYVRPDLWRAFEGLSIGEKDRICVKTAGAMAESYSPLLDYKIASGQYMMHSLIDDELVWIGMQVATAAVETPAYLDA